MHEQYRGISSAPTRSEFGEVRPSVPHRSFDEYDALDELEEQRKRYKWLRRMEKEKRRAARLEASNRSVLSNDSESQLSGSHGGPRRERSSSSKKVSRREPLNVQDKAEKSRTRSTFKEVPETDEEYYQQLAWLGATPSTDQACNVEQDRTFEHDRFDQVTNEGDNFRHKLLQVVFLYLLHTHARS